ncbi:type II secretion system protein E, partial [mine drainage metagenome]
ESLLRDSAAQLQVSADWMLDQQVLIWQTEDSGWWCAARDPLAPSLGELLRAVLGGRPLRMCLARTQDLERTLEALARIHSSLRVGGGDDVAHLRELAEEAPVVELVNNMLAQAVEQRASDLHFEPEENQFTVRFRIDGVLYPRLSLPRERYNAVSSRLKLIVGQWIS